VLRRAKAHNFILIATKGRHARRRRDPGAIALRRPAGENMSEHNEAAAPAWVPKPDPIVRPIRVADIAEALAAGLRDFQAAPLYGLFFGAVYAAGGNLVVLCAYWLGMSYLSYPLAAGFALLGPFVAVGTYEVSRRRETGAPLSWSAVLGAIFAQGKRELGWMAFVTLFIFVVWMYQVRLLLALFLGFRTFTSLHEFLTVVATTPEGNLFLLIGNVVGAAMALVLFSLSVVSFPLLLDRDVDFITAMITSVRAVVASPVPMIGWAIVIVMLSVIAMMPAFLGLLVVLPVLGHTTWHLYRRIVAPVAATGAASAA
jgi:uncharacterized membrane protein